MSAPILPSGLPPGLTLDITDDPRQEDIAQIEQGLLDHALAVAEPFGRREFALFLRNPDDSVAGGAVGHWYETHGSMLISDVWIDESLRGLGLGRALMMYLETAARDRACSHIHLDTFDFQARGFYETLGFSVFGSVRYPKSGRMRYFLEKSLPAA